MLVEIAYPAPFTYIPKGARNERLGFTLPRTSARLRETGRSDLVEVGRFRRHAVADAEPVYAFDGALWRAAPAGGGRDPSVAALVGYLGGAGRREHFVIRENFARTPLGFSAIGLVPQDPIEEGKVREMRIDGRVGAEARAIAFAESDLLVAGGEAFMRTRPVLTAGDDRRTMPMHQAVTIAPGDWRTSKLRTDGHNFACDDYQLFVGCPDRAGDFHEYIGANSKGRYYGGYADAKAPDHGLPKGCHGDGDMLLMAGVLPETALGHVRYALAMVEGKAPADDPHLAALVQARAELARHAVLGNVGGVDLQDAPRLIERSLECMRLAAVSDRSPTTAHKIKVMESWHAMVAAPRLAEIAAAAPKDDMDAVAGFAP